MIVVTGTALTIKYDTNGDQVWTAPYNGTSIAMDLDGNAVVTGFGSAFNTVKISPNGTNLWSTTYDDQIGPAWSQAVVVDSGGNAYVAGADTDACYTEGNSTDCYVGLLIVKYDQNGSQLWKSDTSMGPVGSVQVAGLAIDRSSNIYAVANPYNESAWSVFESASNGSDVPVSSPNFECGPDVAHGLTVDSTGGIFVTGQSCLWTQPFPDAGFAYGTYKGNSNGLWVWTNNYPTIPVQSSVANAIALDSRNNVYVTGYSPGTNTGNDIVTIKYDNNGNQMWLQRYNGPGNGNDVGNAIAVDKSGNVYVTGYETTAAGGTEIVTIKYSPITLKRRSDGTVILQAQGLPGESFDIQASADLQSWLDLGIFTADTNGLLQFDDTNAPTFPARFYFTNPQ
jgi:hypothetical protein